ncbi:MFS transporter [Kytococcus sedentarius]|uniref:MFS transporter n=1 Tax=Kytococcus sedentarius TaxID=1276 RepID=UPI0035BC3CF6
MPADPHPAAWEGHAPGSPDYRRIHLALLCAGLAAFAQLYSPQGVLPLLAADLGVSASQASLTISAATTGLALSVLPWSWVADRVGRVTSMRIALVSATTLGLLVPWCPWFEVMLVLRVLEGAALGGVAALAVTYLTEEVAASVAAVAAGTYIAGTSVGGLVGRVVAAPVADLAGWRTGTFSVALMAAACTLAFFVLTPPPRGFRPQRPSARTILHTSLAHHRDPGLLAAFMQAFLLMGGFVAVYNYLTFRLDLPPYSLPVGVASLVFLAYLAGTAASRIAGGLAARHGRRGVLLASVGVMAVGTLVTLHPWLPLVVLGLVVMTAGFFGVHGVASGWAGAMPEHGRSQATSLYTFWYYAGSSLFGYLGGFAWTAMGWSGVALGVVALTAVAGVWAVASLPRR